MVRPRFLVVFPAAAAVLPAQSTILDVVDGETLYQGGSLVSFSSELERED
ncbi:MAG: hypothetical protein JNK15_10910, partial [Planctomycetes bacterium]|nr:hypothetical protein [Planctomycetota bacterium]